LQWAARAPLDLANGMTSSSSDASYFDENEVEELELKSEMENSPIDCSEDEVGDEAGEPEAPECTPDLSE
jgi:hypothetical protein